MPKPDPLTPADLPDEIVTAMVEAFARKRNPKHRTLDHSETLAMRAALLAVQPLWEAHLRSRIKAEIEAAKHSDNAVMFNDALATAAGIVAARIAGGEA